MITNDGIVDEISWRSGFNAGEKGDISANIPRYMNYKDWVSGYIEGSAKRAGLKYKNYEERQRLIK